MAYETGTASSMADFITLLNSFAVAEGWTSDQLSTGTGQMAMHIDDLYVSFRWNTATPLHLAVYQALGYTGGNDPGNHPNDSGVGIVSSTNTNLEASRGMNLIGSGPYTRYHFFANTSPDYIHVVLEYSPQLYRHMGFGNLVKTGDWTGGEYCYGHYHTNTSPTSSSNTVLLDALYGNASNDRDVSIHAEGFTGQAVGGKWLVGNSVAAPGTDRGGTARQNLMGGFRGGTLPAAFGWLRSNLENGFIPMIPIPAFYWNKTPTPDEVAFMGFMPDTRSLNIAAFAPGQQFIVGADTWMAFPTVRKQHQGVTDESRNQGIAYKVVP